jgi:hypothetical protein
MFHQDLNNNPLQPLQPMVYPVAAQPAYQPTLEQVQQATNCMNTITGYVSASKKYHEVCGEALDNSRLCYQWHQLSRKLIMQIIYYPSDGKDIDWTFIPNDLYNLVDHLRLVTGWYSLPLLFAVIGYTNAAMRGRFKVQINREWLEPIITNMAFIAPSGQRKSLIHQRLIVQFEEFQDNLMCIYQTNKESVERKNKFHLQSESMLRNAILKDALKESRSSETGLDIKAFFEKAEHLAETFATATDRKSDPVCSPLFLADGFTEKKLLRRMFEVGGGQAILEPEGTTLIRQLTNPKFNNNVFLKSFGMEDFGESTINSGDIHVRNPFLNIVSFMQPSVAAKLYENQKLIESGMLARFMPIFVPTALLPNQNIDAISNDSMKYYGQKIRTMLERNFTQENNREIFNIQISASARQRIENFQRGLKNMLSAYSDSSGLQYFVDKLAGHAARIAGILHAWQYDEPEKYDISDQAMFSGIQMAQAILPHARYAHNPSGFQAVKDAEKILSWVRRHRYMAFSSRDIAQYSGVKTNKKIFPALDLLEQHNILTQLVLPQKSRMCLMHPNFV